MDTWKGRFYFVDFQKLKVFFYDIKTFQDIISLKPVLWNNKFLFNFIFSIQPSTPSWIKLKCMSSPSTGVVQFFFIHFLFIYFFIVFLLKSSTSLVQCTVTILTPFTAPVCFDTYFLLMTYFFSCGTNLYHNLIFPTPSCSFL